MSALASASRFTFLEAWGPPPTRPVLAADEVHVWRIPLEGRGDEHLDVLSRSERQRAASFLRPRDSRQYSLTRAAVRAILGRYLDVPPESVEFATGRSGKPSVTSRSGVVAPRYNTTHSGRLALCAVAGVDVGVDLEWMRPAPIAAGVAAGIVSADGPVRPDEPPSIERDWVFFQAWTRTEAALKATGEGLSAIDRRPAALIRALAQLHPEQYRAGLRIIDLPLGLDYAGALAMLEADAVTAARCWTWEASPDAQPDREPPSEDAHG